MTATPRILGTDDFALLDALVTRMDRTGGPDPVVRAAVDRLTARAAPDRADRLAVQAGEPPVLVERLAVWAMQRTDGATVAHAADLLEGAGAEVEDQIGSSAMSERWCLPHQLMRPAAS